jgi:dienelactone hydrolase
MPRAALLAGALLAAALLLAGCAQPLRLARDDSDAVLARHALTVPDPGARGPHAVRTLVYGSGTDRRRAAFRDSVTLRTPSVDATPFVSMAPAVAASRRKYWGFDDKAFPVNGRVWYPDGPGPYPLVLVVHGNHDMKDFSDPGYGYLGEHLASRGFILVSVDENFLNGALRNENDARGWMLLEHLKAWRRFADSSGSPLHGKVDMRNIALMGHSRGGEAVAVAAAFNRLSRYPDDATVTFDYGFDIKGLVAIAPGGRPVPSRRAGHAARERELPGAARLARRRRVVVQRAAPVGSRALPGRRLLVQERDLDVPRQPRPVEHGLGQQGQRQFSGRNLELRALIAPEAQRQMALVFVSGFLEATLKGRREYVPLFRDHRSAGGWLPKAMYQTAYADAGVRPLTDFERTIDVTRGALPAVRLQAESLSTWREAELPMRWRDKTYRTWGAWLGWNNAPASMPPGTGPRDTGSRDTGSRDTGSRDTARTGTPRSDSAARPPRAPATFTIALPDSLGTAWRVGRGSAVFLTLVPTRDVPGPRRTATDSARRDTSSAATPRRAPSAPGRVARGALDAATAPVRLLARPFARRTPAAPVDTTPLDLTVELVDARGTVARLPLSRFGPVRRPLEIRVARRERRDREGFRTTYELVPQTYVLPLVDFASVAPGFDPEALRLVRLRFDRSEKGTVVLTHAGIGAAAP